MRDDHTTLVMVFMFSAGFVCGLMYALVMLWNNRRK